MFVRISGRACTGLHRGRRDDPGPGRRGQDWSWNRNRPGSRVHQVQQGNGIVIASKALNAHLQSSAPVIIPKTGKIFGQIFQQTIFADVPDKLPVWDTDSLKCALTCWEIILIHVLLWKQRNTHNIDIYIDPTYCKHATFLLCTWTWRSHVRYIIFTVQVAWRIPGQYIVVLRQGTHESQLQRTIRRLRSKAARRGYLVEILQTYSGALRGFLVKLSSDVLHLVIASLHWMCSEKVWFKPLRQKGEHREIDVKS